MGGGEGIAWRVTGVEEGEGGLFRGGAEGEESRGSGVVFSTEAGDFFEEGEVGAEIGEGGIFAFENPAADFGGGEGQFAEEEAALGEFERLGGRGGGAFLGVDFGRRRFGAPHLGEDAGGVEAEIGGDLVAGGVLEDGVGDLTEEGGELRGEAGKAAGVVQGAVGTGAEDFVREDIGGLFDTLPKGLAAFATDEGVGIFARWEGEDADGEFAGEEGGKRAVGGGLSGLVAVEAEDDAGDKALEEGGLVRGEGRTLGGDDILNAGFVEGDEIELAFADDGFSRGNKGAFGFVKSEKEAAFGEEGGFRGVDVFGGAGGGIENASAESNDFAVVVVDGNHDTVSEAVGEIAAAFVFVAESGADEFGGLKSRLECPGGEGIVGSRGIAEAPVFRDGFVEGAGLEVGAGRGGGWGFEELLFEPGGGGAVEFQQAWALVAV